MQPTYRSTSDAERWCWAEGCAAPEMRESEAARVVGGFLAQGQDRDVLEALERTLLSMGAQVSFFSRRSLVGVATGAGRVIIQKFVDLLFQGPQAYPGRTGFSTADCFF